MQQNIDLAPPLNDEELRTWYRKSRHRSFTCTKRRLTIDEMKAIRRVFYRLKEHSTVVFWKGNEVWFTGKASHLQSLSSRFTIHSINHLYSTGKGEAVIKVFKKQPREDQQVYLDQMMKLYCFDADELLVF